METLTNLRRSPYVGVLGSNHDDGIDCAVTWGWKCQLNDNVGQDDRLAHARAGKVLRAPLCTARGP